jgi:hypothetical protein
LSEIERVGRKKRLKLAEKKAKGRAFGSFTTIIIEIDGIYWWNRG